jgi:hypothetical protein
MLRPVEGRSRMGCKCRVREIFEFPPTLHGPIHDMIIRHYHPGDLVVRWRRMALRTSAIVKGLTGDVDNPGAVRVRRMWISTSSITEGYGRKRNFEVIGQYGSFLGVTLPSHHR